MPVRPLARLVPILLLTVLWGCDGPGSDPPSPAPAEDPAQGGGDDDASGDTPAPATQEMAVTPSLGKVVGADAQAFDASGTAFSDPVEIGSDGIAILIIPADHTGPMIVRITGKAGAVYFDESTGQDEDFPSTDSFRVALPAPRATTGASILTELAVRLAEAAGSLDAAGIQQANERIRASLTPEVGDLLTVPTLVDATTAANTLDASEGGELAARLAAIVRLDTSVRAAADDPTPALNMLRQLAADAADGLIDGIDGSGGAITTVYAPASFAADFVRAVQDFAAAFGNEALRSSAASAQASVELVASSSDAGSGEGGDDGTTDVGAVDELTAESQEAALLADFAGTFDAVVVESCDSDACPDATAVGDPVTVSIDADGVVTFGSVVLDRRDPSTQFTDFRTSNEPSLLLSLNAGADLLQVTFFVDDGVQAPDSRIRGVRLSKSTADFSDSLYVEVIETRSNYVAFFDDFVTRTTPALRMTFIQRNGTSSGPVSVTSATNGASPLCRSFELSATRTPTPETAFTGDSRPQFVWLADGKRLEPFLHRNSRLVTNTAGERVMSAPRGRQFVLADDQVRVEYGFVDGDATSSSEILLGTINDIASSRQADIDAACADFESLGGTLTLDGPGTLTLIVSDLTIAGGPIYRRVFEFASAGPIEWAELLPADIEYRVEAFAGDHVCTTENETGTLTTTVANANVSCSAQVF